MSDEISPLSSGELEIELLERRLEMNALLMVTPVDDGGCGTFAPTCSALTTCGTFG